MYLIFTDQWKYVTDIPIRRRDPGVAAFDKKIYVTGGYAPGLITNVDCYDPETNTWSEKASMNSWRGGHSLVSLLGRLYAIGGVGQDVKNVEVYDPDNNTWTMLQHKLDRKVDGTGAGLINKYFLINC